MRAAHVDCVSLKQAIQMTASANGVPCMASGLHLLHYLSAVKVLHVALACMHLASPQYLQFMSPHLNNSSIIVDTPQSDRWHRHCSAVV